MSPQEPRRPRSLAGFRAMHATWAEHFGALRELERVLARPPLEVGGEAVLVLPSFARPQNLDLAVRLALRARSIGEIRVVDDHPDIQVARWIEVRHPRLSIHRTRGRVGPVARYLEARASGAARVVSVDDDLFLTPRILDRLVARLDASPHVPHGVYGQRWGGDRFEDNLARFDGEVDLLNRAYAFTAAHLRRYFELLDALGIDLDDPRASQALDDDIPLAFAGEGRPRVHDLGAWLDCPTERAGMARWRRDDAEAVRRALYLRLRARASFDGEPRGVPSRAPWSARRLPLEWIWRRRAR